MRRRHFLLLLFSGVLSFGSLCTAQNETYLTQNDCNATDDTVSDFLMCVGVPSGPGSGEQDLLHLKSLIDSLLDIFNFLESGLNDVPLLNVSGGWSFDTATLLQDDDIIRVWLQISLTPMLSSISQNFLTCLGYNNFTCQTYQSIVQEMSQHFSNLDYERQQWIYSYFIQPFLTINAPSGCVLPGDSTEDWLRKNFGSFSFLAQLTDFSSINAFFNGMDVLHMLSPEQKAELMLYPDTTGLNNDSISVVLGSLMSSLSEDQNTFNGSQWNDGFPVLYSSSPQDPLTQAVNGLMTAFRPVGSFASEFVSLTHQQNLTSMTSATLVQAMLNWTLAELAAPYKNISDSQQTDRTPLDPTDVNSWFTHVAAPVLKRYFTSDIPDDLTAVFHNVFYIQNSVNETQNDSCSVTLAGSCAVVNVVEQVKNVLKCAASTNLTITQETVTSLILHLSDNLNALLNQIANTNFSSEDSPFRDVLDQIYDPEYANLTDENFITMWFRIKLKPLLPSLTPDYLLCLSAKPFSCQTFQILVFEMSNNIFLFTADGPKMVYQDFIVPFLHRQNFTGGCVANDSYEWIMLNLDAFSQFATVQEMYLLDPEFNALEAFEALTLTQVAELIVEDLPELPDKKQLIDMVFSRTLTSVTMRQMLPQLIRLIAEMDMMKNCEIYQEMFLWLHSASLSANLETNAVIQSSIDTLAKETPASCVSSSSPCNITTVSASSVCVGVNSSALMMYLEAPHNTSQLCSFTIRQYACAELTGLSAEDLAVVLLCYLYGNQNISSDIWILFLQRASSVLGPALDLFPNESIPSSLSPALWLDVIGDVIFSTVSPSSFTNNSFIQVWFGDRLRPLLPYVSQNFLSCISKNDLSCETYQSVIQILSQEFDAMSNKTQLSVYVYFIYPFLSSNQSAGCSELTNQSSDWLKLNFGPFAQFATISELEKLNPTFSVLDVLGSLSLMQLVQVSLSPQFISSPAQVNNLLNVIPNSTLGPFYSTLSTALSATGVTLAPTVSEAFLKEVFMRVNLTDPAVSDSEVQQWLTVRLVPFISSIQPSDVPVYFNSITQRSCNISQQGVALLNSNQASFSPDVVQEIYSQLITSLRGPELNCYTNQSFYAFLQSYFMGFPFPPLSIFMSLIPPGSMAQFLNSIPPAQLSDLLNRAGAVDNQTDLCQLFSIYNQTENYLQHEPVSSPAVASQTLQCVWSRALSAATPADTARWLNVSLVQYLPFLSPQLVSPAQLAGASCFSFSQFVSLMGNYNFSMSAFNKTDIYTTIQSYLNTKAAPICYNPSDPLLNSTAWFSQYIGSFISFITVNDLQNFGGEQLAMFTTNSQNLQLFANNNVSQDVITAYSNLLYEYSPEFSVKYLPTQLWCSAPADAFISLNQNEAVSTATTLQNLCTAIDPTVFSALATNVDSLTPHVISALGDSVTGLSAGQLASSNPSTLLASLNQLGSVSGWSQSQAMVIIQSLLSSGMFTITSVDSLQKLGSLLMGVPSATFNSIPPSTLLSALQNGSFLNNIVTTPITTQETVVNQIISVNSTSDSIVQNVPANLTSLIPRTSLLLLSGQTATTLNEKQWTSDQSMLFFDVVADGFPNSDNISFEVLQGFTSTRVQAYSDQVVKNLIYACRPRGNNKVVLEESQLTSMYEYIKNDIVTDFTVYPPEMLLYYNLSQVQPSLCQAYFSALGTANFSVLSPTLAFRKNLLFTSALQCLGVSGLNVSSAQLDVLGQMVCFFNSSYILNSNPYVLEKLKLCATLTGDQSSAVETVLLNGNTNYGSPGSWNRTTLTALGVLPLYLTSNFWGHFTLNDKMDFFRKFVPALKNNGISRESISTMITQAGQVSLSMTRALFRRFRRDTTCTVGVITQVQASDDSFPIGYDMNQFNVCLSAQTLNDNLAAITDKATASYYLPIILNKIKQVYPAGLSDIVLQFLGPASRAASPSDISNWNITTIDTLSTLMNSYNGNWTSDQVNAIISRYLSGNRSLGTMELNALGGAVLCALNTTLLQTISPNSLQLANVLSLVNCTNDQMLVLFNIAKNTFSDKTLTRDSAPVSLNTYQLIQPYLSGADLSYIQTLSISKVSMDVLTLISLNPNVVYNLTVPEMQGLLGRNLPELKTYENNQVIEGWITRQLQSDLDSLGIGLAGGRVPTSGSSSNSSVTTATTTKPSGASSSISTSSWFHKLLLLLLLGVTMAILHD